MDLNKKCEENTILQVQITKVKEDLFYKNKMKKMEVYKVLKLKENFQIEETAKKYFHEIMKSQLKAKMRRLKFYTFKFQSLEKISRKKNYQREFLMKEWI